MAIIACLLIPFKSSVLGDGLFSDIPNLSKKAIDSLSALYDGKYGIESDGKVVVSWTPVDGNGKTLDEMIVRSTQRGSGAAELIKYSQSGKLTFDDTSDGADGRYLEGVLTNDESKEFTVFWVGNYSAEAPLATSGTYVSVSYTHQTLPTNREV